MSRQPDGLVAGEFLGDQREGGPGRLSDTHGQVALAQWPMATTRYHRWVVMASVIRLLTGGTPTLLAVS